MKLLVFGHSDSDGSHLPDAADALPWLLQRMLTAATGEEPQVLHRVLYAGPTARAFVDRELDRHQPDIVILCTTTHNVTVRLVSNRVRERWGERAARLAERAERSAAAASGRFGRPGRVTVRTLRKSARRVLGTRPTMTVDEMVQCYDDVMTAIASHEQVHCIIGGGIGYIGEIRELNPGIDELQAFFQEQFRRSAEARHFDWLSQADVLGGPGAKDQYYQPDGMHTDARSHQLFAEALFPLVLARL